MTVFTGKWRLINTTTGTKMVVVKKKESRQRRNGPGVAMSGLQILPKSFGTITNLTASISIPPMNI